MFYIYLIHSAAKSESALSLFVPYYSW